MSKVLEWAVESGLPKWAAVALNYAGLLAVCLLLVTLTLRVGDLIHKNEELGCANVCSCEDMLGLVYYPPYSGTNNSTTTPEYVEFIAEHQGRPR